MPEGFKKFPLDEKEKPFAAGAERKVYRHPRKKERVVAVENVSFRRNEQQARQEYYLTKIMHILLPDNIPDIHSYGSRPSMSVRQNVELGTEHKIIQEQKLANRTKGGRFYDIDSKVRSSIINDPRTQRLQETLQNFGLNVDPYAFNFGFDEKGNAKYIEPFSALTDYHIRYDRKKILEAIKNIKDQKQRARALRYLARLDALVAEKKDPEEYGKQVAEFMQSLPPEYLKRYREYIK